MIRIYIQWAFLVAVAFCATAAVFPAPKVDSEQDLCGRIEHEIQAGQIDAAIDQARRALKGYPNSSPLNHLLGVALFSKGLRNEAATAFTRAIALDPGIPDNYFNLALVELNKGDARAIQHLETFVRLAPSNAEGHLLLGRAYQYGNLTLPAIEEYKKALELAPRLALSHYHLAMAYQSQGNLNAALEEFTKEIELNPDFQESYWLTGNIELERGNLDAAEKLFRNSISRKPETFQAHYGLAQVLVAKSQFPEAEAELKKCLALNTTSIQAHYMLARTYQRRGKADDAEREYQIISSLHAQRHAHVVSGIAARQP